MSGITLKPRTAEKLKELVHRRQSGGGPGSSGAPRLQSNQVDYLLITDDNGDGSYDATLQRYIATEEVWEDFSGTGEMLVLEANDLTLFVGDRVCGIRYDDSLYVADSLSPNHVAGMAGTDFNIVSSSGGLVTFNLPDASTTARGVVSAAILPQYLGRGPKTVDTIRFPSTPPNGYLAGWTAWARSQSQDIYNSGGMGFDPSSEQNLPDILAIPYIAAAAPKIGGVAAKELAASRYGVLLMDIFGFTGDILYGVGAAMSGIDGNQYLFREGLHTGTIVGGGSPIDGGADY